MNTTDYNKLVVEQQKLEADSEALRKKQEEELRRMQSMNDKEVNGLNDEINKALEVAKAGTDAIDCSSELAEKKNLLLRLKDDDLSPEQRQEMINQLKKLEEKMQRKIDEEAQKQE